MIAIESGTCPVFDMPGSKLPLSGIQLMTNDVILPSTFAQAGALLLAKWG